METFESRWLRKYERKLGLAWPVVWRVVSSATCHIASDPIAQIHEICVPGIEAVKPRGEHFVDAVHELCHGALAERLDVAFATLRFSRCYANLEGEEGADFEERATMLYVAWCHVDVWVDELMAKELPEIARAERATFESSIALVLKHRPQALEKDESVLGLAIGAALERRRGAPSECLEQAIETLSPQRREVSKALCGVYEALPRLTFERKKDLEALVVSVQEVALLLGLPISPRTVLEEGNWHWLV